MMVQATDGSGSFSALVVQPKTTPTGAVVLIQEIFGVNDAMRATAADMADLGFIAVCPDLFWRLKPGIDLTDKTEAEWKQAMEYLGAFDQAKGVEDLVATVAAARTMPGCNGKVGTVGFCLGGRLAVMMAAGSDADVNVSYYGVGIDDQIAHFSAIKAPLVLHIAGEDGLFPRRQARRRDRRSQRDPGPSTPSTIPAPTTASPAWMATIGAGSPPPSPTAAPPKPWQQPWDERRRPRRPESRRPHPRAGRPVPAP